MQSTIKSDKWQKAKIIFGTKNKRKFLLPISLFLNLFQFKFVLRFHALKKMKIYQCLKKKLFSFAFFENFEYICCFMANKYNINFSITKTECDYLLCSLISSF